MAGRHVAVRPPSTWGRKAITVAAVVGVTASICGAAPTPATAAPVTGRVRALPAQTLPAVGPVPVPAVLRDPVSATSQADLDAARQAAAAAARAAEEAHQAALAAVASSSDPDVVFDPPAPARSGSAIVAFAQQYVGVVSYSTGASPAAGFECDGLVQWVYGNFGVHLPRGVTAQAASGVQISQEAAQAGDLVVYQREHIGIYDGNGGIIDSPDWGRKVSHRPIWGHPIFIRIP